MKGNKALLVLTAATLATIGLTGCGTKTAVTGVSIEAPSSYVDYQGTLQLTATVEGKGKFDDTVTWSLSSVEDATISEDGLVTNNTELDSYVVAVATANGDETQSASVTLTLYGKAELYDFDLKTTSFITGQATQVEVIFDKNGRFDESVTFEIGDEDIATITADGVLTGLVENGETTLTVTPTAFPELAKTFDIAIHQHDTASGYVDYSNADADVKKDILGALETYAVDSFLTGIPFMGSGSYVMYADGIQKGSNTYIPGYGFGILGEGDITQDLAGEENAAWKRYYHGIETEDPQSLNYMNDKGAVVGDLITYVSSAYFDTEMSETKDSYEWVSDLAKVNRPIAVDPAEDGTSKTFKFPVKVGSELKYSTNTKVGRLAEFNNREVKLEDYITPYKIYYTQAYGLARSTENLDSSGSLSGTKAYYNASANGFNAAAWENVGIKAYVDEEDGQSYLEFTFNQAYTPFYAMYYLSSGMFAPVPEEFILACGGANNTSLAEGVKNWGVSNEAGTEGPADHFLSTGPYTVEVWNKDQNIVFQKNANYDDRGRYAIKGIHLNIFPAAGEDENAAFREFLANRISSCRIPTDYLAEYKNDPRTTMTSSTSNWKLNLNVCDEETWNDLFGPNGSVNPGSSWEVEPAMSNKNFLKGLSYAIDRVTFADKFGTTPAYEYLSDNYMIDPENGISWNSTAQHKAAVKGLIDGTDGFGYSAELATQYFKLAAEELIENGDYEVGDTINIEMAWQTTSNIETYGNDLATFFEGAFNSANTGLTLKINHWVGSVWSDVYYKKMMIGQFDIGFGSISGNTYDPLGFLNVLSSDPNINGNFCLNWGVNTNEVDGSIVYDGKVWSFDGLWQAADHGAVISNGHLYSLVPEAYGLDIVREADGGLTVYLWADDKFIDEENQGFVYAICLFAATKSDYSDYDELYAFAEFDEENGCYVFSFSADDIADWLEAYPAASVYVQGFDLYYAEVMNGEIAAQFGYTFWSGLIPEIPQP